MNRSLCKHCKDCQTYQYERINQKGDPIKFIYCNGNKDIVESSNWYYKNHYVCSCRTFWGKKRLLHNVFKTENNLVIDHHNGDKNDNRLINLRSISARCNSQNRHCNDSSIFPGVSRDKDGMYRSYIYIKHKYVHLGRYPNEFEAFHKYVCYCDEHGLTLNRETPAYHMYKDWINNKNNDSGVVV